MFPTTSVLDDFNRSNSADLGANWNTPVYPGDGAMQVISNQVGRTTGSSFYDEYWAPGTFGPDSEAYVDIATKPANGQVCYLFLRLQTPGGAGVDGYYIELAPQSGTDVVNVYRLDDSGFTLLDSFVQEFANGDGLGCDVVGTTVTVYRRSSGVWSSIGSVVDGTYTGAGYIGMGVSDTSSRLDNFGGGTVVVGGTEYPQTVSGSLTPAGSLARQARKPVVGTATPTASLLRRTVHALVSTLTPAGVLTGVRLFLRDLTGNVAMVGTLFRRSAKGLAAVLTPGAALVKRSTKAAVGAVTGTGLLARLPNKTAQSMLALGGTLVRQTAVSTTGTLTPVSLLQSIRAFLRSVTGSLEPAGGLVRRVAKSAASTLAFTSLIAKTTSTTTTGTLSGFGGLTRRTGKAFLSAMNPAGTLNAVRTFLQAVTGSVAIVGTLTKQALVTTTGALIATSTLPKLVFIRSLTAALNTASQLVKATRKGLGSAVALAAALLGGLVSTVVTPAKRTLSIRSELRTRAVGADNRLYTPRSSSREDEVP